MTSNRFFRIYSLNIHSFRPKRLQRALSKKYHSIIHFELSYPAIFCERVFERRSSPSFGKLTLLKLHENKIPLDRNSQSDRNDSSILMTTRMRMLEDSHNISRGLYLSPSCLREPLLFRWLSCNFR